MSAKPTWAVDVSGLDIAKGRMRNVVSGQWTIMPRTSFFIYLLR